MSLATLKTDITALEAAVVSGKPSPILRTVGPVEADVADIVDMFVTPTGMAAAKPVTFGADPDKAAVLACCDNIEAECKKKKAAPVAAWGDGTLFNVFLQNLPALIQMIKELVGK